MKYIITDKKEVVLGHNTFHQTMAKSITGRVVAAGHVEFDGDVAVRVWGKSFGYGIGSKVDDLRVINECKDRIEVDG